MPRRDRHPLVRASPVWGAIGGLITAATGFRYPDAPLADEIRVLFEISPLLGYATFAAFGALLGWAFRAFERRTV